jgi:hypothetical protein
MTDSAIDCLMQELTELAGVVSRLEARVKRLEDYEAAEMYRVGSDTLGHASVEIPCDCDDCRFDRGLA